MKDYITHCKKMIEKDRLIIYYSENATLKYLLIQLLIIFLIILEIFNGK